MTQRSALIIEDDPKLCVIFKTALQQAGFETELDSTGDHFSRKLSTTAPDLVILDIHLPYASGKDILEEIRSSELWNNTVVIVTTDHGMSIGEHGRTGKSNISDDDDLERAGGVTIFDRIEVQPWLEKEDRFSFVTSDPRAQDLACYEALTVMRYQSRKP